MGTSRWRGAGRPSALERQSLRLPSTHLSPKTWNQAPWPSVCGKAGFHYRLKCSWNPIRCRPQSAGRGSEVERWETALLKASLPHWGLSLSPSVLLQHRSESYMLGTSLVGQWLRIQAFTTGGIGSRTKFPSGRTKTLYATQCSQKKEKEKKSTNVSKKVKKRCFACIPCHFPDLTGPRSQSL